MLARRNRHLDIMGELLSRDAVMKEKSDINPFQFDQFENELQDEEDEEYADWDN